ncbi:MULTISPECIES: head completion/stabilization protein [unclassified Providencia]|uniref:head completion/stabilization protein n=1 Tax=unclassified Providencia TaxID=2633465 RepID=UPI002349859B|nr:MULTISPECIES: head completion/stabilization protein [unclassified Providencia]
MSLVATKQIHSVQEESINDGDEKITSGDFWPVIGLAQLRQSMRLTGNVTTSRLKHMATEAVLYVNQQLDEWRQEQNAKGFNQLSAVPSPVINDTMAVVFRYHHAVYSFTKALLIENYRDIDTTREGEKHAQALRTQIDDLRRDGQNAVRDILGKLRMFAEIV